MVAENGGGSNFGNGGNRRGREKGDGEDKKIRNSRRSYLSIILTKLVFIIWV